MQALCVIGGTLWTGGASRAEADSILVGGGKIAAVGRYEEIRAHSLFPGSKKIRLRGETVIPGLSDCHLHLLAYAKQKMFADLSAARSKAEALALLTECANGAKADDWICGYNFNEMNWPEQVMPDRGDLDGLGIANPMLMQRVCTHATVLNSAALRDCGLDRSGAPGVFKDAAGEPTGVVVEDVQAVAHSAMSRAMFSRERLLECLRAALDECASYGLTGLFTCGAASLGMEEFMSLYQELFTKGELKARIFAYHDTPPAPEMTTGFGNGWIRYQGLKIFLDGSLGARTAALSEPYSDAPSERGMLLHETDELARTLARVEAIGCQALVHTIGDAALDRLLDALEAAREGNLGKGAAGRLPLLVNHCMICRPDQIARMKRLGAGATVQPTFVQSDRFMAPPRLGERIGKGWAYPWRSLMEAGVVLGGSSDCPIEPLNPWRGIWAAVERKADADSDAWMPQQRLTVEEALRLYTVNPAVNAGMDAWRGTLEEGKEGDIVILDRNIWDRPEAELKDVKAACTVAGGRITHGNALWAE